MSTIFISATEIGTPRIANALTLCKGAALIPPIPDIPFGFQAGQAPDLRKQYHFGRFHIVRASAEFAFEVHAGLCGPAYAIGFNAEGDAEDDILTLVITEDEAMAGIFLGAGFNIDIGFSCDYYRVGLRHWGWHTGPHIEFGATVDAFKAGIEIIMALLGIEDLFPEGVTELATEAAGTPLAMIGASHDEYANNSGVLQLDCIFSVPINLWTILVVAAGLTLEIPYVDVASVVILAVHEALNATLSSIGFGPSIGVDIPVMLEIADVTIDGVKFNKTQVTGDGKWKGQKDIPLQPLPSSPEEISFNMAHHCGVDFTVGVFAEMQLVELFHVGASMDVAIMALFNLEPFSFGTVHHSLNNTIGEELLAAGCGCDDLRQKVGLVDVEFV